MPLLEKSRGFSLIEILISLFVVSFTAANISGLQILLNEQNRENTLHSLVQQLATEKIEEILQYASVNDLDSLPGLGSINVTRQFTDFTLNWDVSVPPINFEAPESVRKIALHIHWLDTKGGEKNYTYSQFVNLAQLHTLNTSLADMEAAIIESFLATNEVIYFENKMPYKAGAFVIYNSELFEATSSHLAGNGAPRNSQNANEINDGWTSHGLINNPVLTGNEKLTTLYTP